LGARNPEYKSSRKKQIKTDMLRRIGNGKNPLRQSWGERESMAGRIYQNSKGSKTVMKLWMVS